MGFLDKAKQSLSKAVDQHGGTIEKGAEQLGRTINQRTGNKHVDKVAKGTAQLKKHLNDHRGGTEGPRKP